jgi:hypothetical protein
VIRRLARPVAVVLVAILLAFLVWQHLFGGGGAIGGQLVASQPVAVIGSGSEAVAVAADGSTLAWYRVPEDSHLPQLPLQSPPKGKRLAGPALEQIKVLAAAPPALAPYVESSSFGESGVDVELVSGIELRFGAAAQASRKWRAVAAVLADPSIEALDYVNVSNPSHPSTGGSGHALPPLP